MMAEGTDTGAIETQVPEEPRAKPWEDEGGEEQFHPALRYFLVFLSIAQILFMLFYWLVYVVFVVAGITFAPGRALELTNFGAILTAFVIICVGTTGYDALLLCYHSKKGKRATVLWLLVRVVLNAVWIVLPIVYLVWLVRNPYVVPYTIEVVGVVAASLVFMITLLWNTVRLYRVLWSRNPTSKRPDEAAPLLYVDDNEMDDDD